METAFWNLGFLGVWVKVDSEFHRTEYARWWYWAAIDRPSCWSICLIFFVNNANISFVCLCEETIWKAVVRGRVSAFLARVGTTFSTFWASGYNKQKNSNITKKNPHQSLRLMRVLVGGQNQTNQCQAPKRKPWPQKWFALERPSQYSCQNKLINGPICNVNLCCLNSPSWIDSSWPAPG